MHFSGGLIQTNLCRVSGGVGFGDDSWVQYAEKEIRNAPRCNSS